MREKVYFWESTWGYNNNDDDESNNNNNRNLACVYISSIKILVCFLMWIVPLIPLIFLQTFKKIGASGRSLFLSFISSKIEDNSSIYLCWLQKKLAAVPFGPVIQKQRARLWCPNLGREAENWSTIVFVASPLSGCFRIEGSVREAGSVSSSAWSHWINGIYPSFSHIFPEHITSQVLWVWFGLSLLLGLCFSPSINSQKARGAAWDSDAPCLSSSIF